MKSDFYKINEIKSNVYRINSPENVFVDLFVGRDKALLLDTGYGYGNLNKVIKEITDLPLFIVNSHGHLDHTCGNYQFEEKIYIHSKDIELCKEHNSYNMRKLAIKNGRHAFSETTGKEEDILPVDLVEEEYINAGIGKLVPVEEGHIFELGGITLEVFEVPGHTPGSIALLYKEEKMLYVGDAMNQFLWLFLPEALKLSDYIKTLEKAKDIEFEELVISHEAFIAHRSIIDDFIYVAKNLDYENGILFESELAPSVKARICTGKGYNMKDIDGSEIPRIVISDSHLK